MKSGLKRAGRGPAAVLPPLALLPLVIAAASCSFPPFQEGLSLGVITAKKLGEPLATVGPLYSWVEEMSRRETVFIPSKADLLAWTGPASPIEGFAVIRGGYSLRLLSVRCGGTSYYVQGDRAEPMDSGDGTAFAGLTEAVQGGDLLSLTRFNGATGGRPFQLWDSGFSQIAGVDLNARLEVDFPLLATLSPRTIGAGFHPAAGPDRFHCLAVDAAGRFTEAWWLTDPYSGLDMDVTDRGTYRGPAPLQNLPAVPARVWYAHDPASGNSYLSYHDAGRGRYRTFRWNDGLRAEELPGVHYPVRAVLSTGRLFGRGEDNGCVYSADGEAINRFPMGDLHLACELDGGAGARLYFTLSAFGRDRNKRSYVIFYVYSVPTGEIESL